MGKIGFIGLGIMGKPMAKNLLKAGRSLVVYDINAAAVDDLAAAGADRGANAEDVARQCEVILTMLPNSPHVKKAVLGEGGVLAGIKKGTILIDMSSIAPFASQEVCTAVVAQGGSMLDAPVSGGEPKAIDGTLSIMVGGDEAVFLQVKELLLHMGSSVVLCGGIGAGNTVKLANQVIVAANIAALSEALMLGKLAGVAPEAIFSAIKGGLAGSTVMNAKAPMMMSGDFKPGFRVELHIKDLWNAIETGNEIGAPLPLTALTMQMMQWLKANGKHAEDHSALLHYYEGLAGRTLAE